MQPTDEQLEAVAAFKTGSDLRINAFAGTGKTTTLTLLARQTRQRGLYLAFNKSIAQDAAGKFPPNVSCSTVHSLAFRATPSEFRRGDKMTGYTNANALAGELEIEDWFVGGHKVSARSQGHLVLSTLKRFMHGDRDTFRPEDVPLLGRMKIMTPEDQQIVVETTLERAATIWSRMRDPQDRLPLGHDGYLKLWALGRPRLAGDFIMLDEAQDTNPVVLGVLGDQPCQIVYVGDRHQQIYEWRGAINAMQAIETPNQTYLTTSFRFGPELAAAATQVLRRLGESHALKGNTHLQSYLSATNCRTILARTNASVISTVIDRMREGYSVHVVGGVQEVIRMLRAVGDLKRGRPSDIPEFFGFANWNEVCEFSRSDEGEELRTFVSLVEAHGETRLIATLNRAAADESGADLIVSTAHKAKGREWDTVELTDDFLKSRKSKDEADGQPPKLDPEEIRLFYVALTRARKAVEVSPAVLSMLDIAVTVPLPGGGGARPTGQAFVAPVDPNRTTPVGHPQPLTARQSPARGHRYSQQPEPSSIWERGLVPTAFSALRTLLFGKPR